MSEPNRPTPVDPDAQTAAPPARGPGDGQPGAAPLSGPATEGLATAAPGTEGEATRVSMQPLLVALPEQTGRYCVLGEIGRGGMGVVLLGRDEEMDRQLAIKVLLDGLTEGPEGVRRFLEEARVAGRLQHPGIVPIYDVGRFGDGRPYFTMKLVQGRTLAELLHDRADPGADLPRLLKVFEQVCQTLAYAHSRGVIHRDL